MQKIEKEKSDESTARSAPIQTLENAPCIRIRPTDVWVIGVDVSRFSNRIDSRNDIRWHEPGSNGSGNL